ncbi:GAF domain-containing sensor histidine kinase [Alicyclobacillus sp. ALC3]|uniref:GAF domain-containing sensor histidine kinase n=1 Tax=Alicyclobacillus sp. ALC3 TaxID=2796143 RepID=UPI00237884C0|nr:GAF domain-containing protein [Alicyclobacillus sp. ALC3]WDL96268.1 GAF domain-containing protein [Alicyclobacillus sp. ALC3]
MTKSTRTPDISRMLTDTLTRLGPLMDGTPDACLQAVIDSARSLVGADYAGLIVLDREEPTSYRYFKVSGWDRTPHSFPRGHGVFTLPAKTGQSLRIEAVPSHPLSVGTPGDHPPVNAFLGVPIACNEAILGCMFFGKPRDGGVFTQHDEDIMVAFSTISAMIIQVVDQKDAERTAIIYGERRRIANALHDTLSQSLFVLRKEFEQLTQQLSLELTSDVKHSLSQLQDLVQLCQSDLRAALFQLTDTAPHPSMHSLAQMVQEFERTTGISTQLLTEGDFGRLSAPIRQVVTKVTAESLANVYRHAQSDIAVVHVAVNDELAQLVIQDAGIGISEEAVRLIIHPTGHFGLHSMAQSVRDAGGRLSVFRNEDGGTTVQCEFPVRNPIP